ncbi:hypothetical protein K1X76_11605 [bacterium]|nr:hypothetical protein [bacterium]
MRKIHFIVGFLLLIMMMDVSFSWAFPAKKMEVLNENEVLGFVDGCSCLFKNDKDVVGAFNYQDTLLVKRDGKLFKLKKEGNKIENFISSKEKMVFKNSDMTCEIVFGQQERALDEVWADENTRIVITLGKKKESYIVHGECGC